MAVSSSSSAAGMNVFPLRICILVNVPSQFRRNAYLSNRRRTRPEHGEQSLSFAYTANDRRQKYAKPEFCCPFLLEMRTVVALMQRIFGTAAELQETDMLSKVTIAHTDLQVSRLCYGTNMFGT